MTQTAGLSHFMQELSHSQFLDVLKQRNIEIYARDGRLQLTAPPGAVDAQLRAELTRRKPELLDALQGVKNSADLGSLTRMERSEKIPQTHAQQGLWLIDHFSPGNVAYNIPEAFLLDAPVNLEILQRAADALLKRHETLRTSFYEEEGELFQSVWPHAETTVEFTDLSVVIESNRDSILHNLIRQQARRSFDLQRAPLVRFHLFRLSENRHVIFFNIHHIIADRRSLTILHEELNAFYQAYIRNESVRLPELAVQYADYALWASKRLADGTMGDQIEYWKGKLAGAPAFLELPFSRPYPEQRTAWGATIPVVVSATVRDALSEIGRQESATMFMTLLAAFALLIYLNSGVEDFCIGSPFTHRNQVETESIIGLFVNMLAFRCRMNKNLSFRELLQLVRATALEAYENSDIPFQELVRVLKPDPRTMRSPLFQIMFGFDSQAESKTVGFEQIDTEPGTARFDLTLQMAERPEGLAGTFEYCTDLFEVSDIERIARQFPILLDWIVQHPNQPVSSYELPGLASSNHGAIKPERQSEISSRTMANFWSDRIDKLMQRLTHRS